MNKITSAILALALIFLFTSCGKKSGQEQTSQKEETKKEETVQKQQEKNDAKNDSINAANENSKKEKFVKFALEEDKMINDEKGQFAADAEASSSYGDTKENSQSYSPWQATGKPNCENYADDGRSWTSKDADKGIEWLRLKFEKPVNATEVRIRQNMGPGAVIKIDLIDTDGKSHTIWEGIDKTKYDPELISWFYAKFDKTAYKTKEVKITLATNTIGGWNEIDAVQLIGE